MFVCFIGKYTWAYEKVLKIKNYAYELITSWATWNNPAGCMRPAGWAALT